VDKALGAGEDLFSSLYVEFFEGGENSGGSESRKGEFESGGERARGEYKNKILFSREENLKKAR
jgi:hypothetical protein